MTYRLEFTVRIYADNAEAACKFRDMVEDFVAENFTEDTACLISSRVEPALDEKGNHETPNP